MKKMSTDVWSVNGTVTSKKTIKLHGLLSGEDFDLTMEPGVKANVPMREIVIKDKAWASGWRDLARRQRGRPIDLQLDARSDHGRSAVTGF